MVCVYLVIKITFKRDNLAMRTLFKFKIRGDIQYICSILDHLVKASNFIDLTIIYNLTMYMIHKYSETISYQVSSTLCFYHRKNSDLNNKSGHYLIIIRLIVTNSECSVNPKIIWNNIQQSN